MKVNLVYDYYSNELDVTLWDGKIEIVMTVKPDDIKDYEHYRHKFLMMFGIENVKSEYLD